MTAAAVLLSGFAPFGLSEGVSADAQKSQRLVLKLVHAAKAPAASAMSPLVNELYGLESTEDVAPGAVQTAVAFALQLPSDVMHPELSVDSDGDVAFDWGSDEGIVSVRIGPNGRIVYAGEVGGKPASDTTQIARELPAPLRQSLAAFRSAR